MSDYEIRTATADDLRWIHAAPDPAQVEELAKAEIEEARTATPTPRFWQPIEVEEMLLR